MIIVDEETPAIHWRDIKKALGTYYKSGRSRVSPVTILNLRADRRELLEKRFNRAIRAGNLKLAKKINERLGGDRYARWG